MKVECDVETVTLQTTAGRPVTGVRVSCTRCNHSTESFGQGGASIRRCLVMLREECPEDEENFYEADDSD